MTMTLTQVTTGGVDENINIDSNTLKVDGTNNRVGIGTAAPSTTLHLTGTDNSFITLEHATRTGKWLIDHSGTNSENLDFRQNNGSTTVRSYLAGRDVHEFYTGGFERMKIDSQGNVGIGSSPVADAVLTLSRETDTALFFRRGGGTNQDAAIRCAGGDFQFLNGANSSTVAGLNERMRIDNLGNVGIGNSSPTNSNGYNTLTLGNGTSTGGQIHLNNSSGANFYLWHDSQGANFYNQSASSQIFYTGAGERMRLDSSGRLMLGTSTTRAGGLAIAKGYSSSSPAVPAAGTSTSSLFVGNDDGGMYGLAMGANGSGNGYIQAQRSDGNTTVYDLYLQPNGGKVSIGTTAANAQLNVYGGASATLYQNSNTGNGSGDGFFVGNWGGMSGSVWNYENDIINFGTNNAERVRIDNSGRLMVGRTTATHKLSLAGAANDKTAEIQLTASNVASGYIGPNSDGLNIGTDTAGIVFKTGVTGGGSVGATGTTRFSISSSGVITTNTVQQHFDRGSSTGQSSFTRDFTIGNTQSALVIAAFNHYGLFSYGCTKMSFAATGASFSTSDIHNQTSTPGGSWSISKPNNTTLRITKNAGNYNGSGHWFIHIIAS